MTREKHLETMLTLVGASLIFGLIFEVRELLLLAVALVLIGLFSKWLTSKISWLWLAFAEKLGAVMSKVLLSVVFFVFLVPIAFLSRLFSKKSMIKQKGGETSFYVTRDHDYSSEDLENVW